ncbi:MAG: DUF3500 domain-containing protein, partial [Planctomycetales bacterium]|nr:DUF3500 domain-containing protein [Planctomycetales bacterium]
MSIHRFLRPCRTLGFVLLIVGAFNIASAHEDAGPIAVQMVSAANEFLDTLTPELKQQITFKFDGPERTDWHFIPKDRTGVKLKDLSLEQRRAAHHLLHTTLSSAGYLKATSIMNLENVLRLLESDQADVNQRRDPEKYWLAIYGTPSTDQPWGWRIEGHHLSLNFSTVEGIVASTPLFLGANPAEVRVGPSTGLRVLGEEEDMARGLLAMLNEEQRQQATIATEAPKDVITAP